MKLQLEHNNRLYSLDLAQTGKTTVVTLDGQTYTVEILRAGEGRLDLRFSASSAVESASPSAPPFSSAVDSASNLRFSASQSVPSSAVLSVDGAKRWVTLNGQTFVFTLSAGVSRRGGAAHAAAGELRAPMPGQIRAVPVAEGETVSKGQTLVVIEAMKMELKVAAPFEGVVKMLKVRPGQTVEKDELLVEIASKMNEN
ncbi:MAG: acetyl-CoA carboxylase biotin carboxyl carrier protein subunit [Anaerolineales bacterium]|nr:acetyl-CoA carboxylase biotin carboxyl carrier protein subunit [Anaerolineales bacterium]